MPEGLNFGEESVEKKKDRLLRQITEYQRDRTNKEAQRVAMESIKERTLVLPRDEYEKYIDIACKFLPEPDRKLRKLMFGFSDVPNTRAVLNKDSLDAAYLPYIITHEETEILEDGPYPWESRKWEEEHNGAKHPQENIISHVEATYAEYRHAKRDGKLDEHHKYVVNEIKNLMTDETLKDLILTEKDQRNRIYREVKN